MTAGRLSGIGLALLALGGAASVRAEGAAAQPAPKLALKLFAQLERTRTAEISPDGRNFVAISNRNGRYCVTIHPLPVHAGKIVLYDAPDSDFEYRWAHWAGDSRVLISAMTAFDRGIQGVASAWWSPGTETRLLSAAADGSSIINAIRPIKEASTGSQIKRQNAESMALIQDDVIDWLPSETNHVLVSIKDHPIRERNAEPGAMGGLASKDRGAAVRKIDVTSGEYTYVKAETPGIYEWRTDRDGQVRLGFGVARGDTISRFLLYRDPASDKWREIDDSPLTREIYAFAGFDSDPRYALVIGPDASDRAALLRFDVGEGKVAGAVYSDPQSDVESIVYAPDRSRQVLGVRLQDGREVYFDEAWKKRMALLHDALPGMRLLVTSATKDQKQFIVRAASAREPGVYYLFDADRRELTAIEYARSGLEPEQLAPVRWVEYRSRDGLAIHALLTLPRGVEAKNLPAVLLPHGGPATHDVEEFDWIAQFLANRGYAVLQPNFRGSTGYGIAFERAGDRQWGRAMQDDLTDGVQWLTQQGIADPKRMAIVGGSYGGYAALMGAVRTPELFRCAVSLNGVSDLIALFTSDRGYFKDEEAARRIGDPSADRAMLEEVSPIQRVDRIGIPVLLLHARDDLRVSFSQSERMYDALRKAGKPAEFVAIEKGQHWLLNEAARTQLLTSLEAFLEKNLRARGG